MVLPYDGWLDRVWTLLLATKVRPKELTKSEEYRPLSSGPGREDISWESISAVIIKCLDYRELSDDRITG